MLSGALALPAAAQTTDPVWSATMTAGDTRVGHGYDATDTPDTPAIGALDDDDFDYGSLPYRVLAIDVATPENGTAVATLAATDADSDPITWLKTGGADTDRSALTTAGALTFVAAPDYESPADVASADPANDAANNEYVVFVTASDGTDGTELKLVVRVTNADEGRSGTVSIDDTAPMVGDGLTASTTGVADPDGLPDLFAPTWQGYSTPAGGPPEDVISGATSATYTVVEDDLGTALTAKASRTDVGGFANTLARAPTAATARAGICGRTRVVWVAIIRKMQIPGVTNCNDVTDAHLAAISGRMYLGSKGITSLKEGDFSGLTALQELPLDNNFLTGLPAGVFDGLTALTTLNLGGNAMTGLPAGVFDGLTALTDLRLNSNSLSELPAGVFDGLTALTDLRLQNNSLSNLPAGAFDRLTALTYLHLNSNSLSELPAGAFENLTALTYLALDQNPGTDDFVPTANAGGDQRVAQGAAVTLDGSASGGAWGTNVTYQWTKTSGATVTLSGADTDSASFPAPSSDGDLVFTLTVTGKGGSTYTYTDTDTATVRVGAASTDATLSALSLSDGTLAPTFAVATTDYTALVANSVDEVTVTATENHASATVKYYDAIDAEIADADTNAAGHQVALAVGANTIVVAVTAEDGSTSQDYTVTVTRAAADTPPTCTLNTGDLWCGVMTVGEFPLGPSGGTGRGYRFGQTGSLPDDEFPYDGDTPYRVHAVYYVSAASSSSRPAGTLALSIGRGIPDGLTLQLGNEQFPTSNATSQAGTSIFWSGSGLNWSVGEHVTLRLRGEAPPALSVADAAATEGDAVEFVVTLSAVSGRDVTVDYATSVESGDSATSGTDFTAVSSGTLTFTAGDTEKTFTVSTTEDTTDEENETFMVTLSSASNASISDATAKGTITDDDAAGVRVSATALTVTEQDAAGGSYTVVLDTEPTHDVTVTVGGHAGTDVSLSASALTFTTSNWDRAQTVTVTALNDDDTADDAVTLTHAATSTDGNYSGIAIADVTVTVTDNDTTTPAVTLVLSAGSIGEDGGVSTVTATVSPASAAAFTVTISAAAGAPTISGTPQVGEELTASTSGIADADGLDNAGFAYQWIRTDTDIQGATGSTYTAVDADEGKRLKVRISFTDDAGHEESLTSAATDAVAAAPESLTARFVGMPAEHRGEGGFHFRVAFSKDIGISFRSLREDAFTVTGGRVTGGKRVDGRRDLFRMTVRPDSDGDVTITLPAGRECEVSGAICTKGEPRRQLTNSPSSTMAGPVGIAVADARVEEGADAVLAFAVTLSRAASGTLTVDYATSDGTATAGEDYTATSGTLTFEAGESEKTIEVTVLDDAHDEGEETLTLRLSDPSGGRVTDGEATGTIENHDPLPRAFMARFGRAAALHVVEQVQERIEAQREVGIEAQFAGRQLRPGMEREMAVEFLSRLAPSLGANRVGAGVPHPMSVSPVAGSGSLGTPGLGGGAPMGTADELLGGANPMGSMRGTDGGLNQRGHFGRGLGGGNLLTGSSFVMNHETRRGGILSFWSRGAQSRFAGRDGQLSLDGRVRTTMFGADYAKGPLVTGLSLSHSRGLGGYSGVSAGEVTSSVTGLYPWLGYKVSDRITLWGVTGYGKGALTLTPGAGTALRSGLSMAMTAGGMRGELADSVVGGFGLAFKADRCGWARASRAWTARKGVWRRLRRR